MPGVLCLSPTNSPVESVLGEPWGTCDICGLADAAMSCPNCGLGGFCGPKCLTCQDDDREEHTCPQGRITAILPSTDELLVSIAAEDIRMSQQALRDYYFDKCTNEHDMSHLLSMYGTLINDLHVNKFQLHEWMLAKKIHKNAVRMFNRDVASVLPIAFIWLLTNSSVFDEEDITDCLDTDAFEVVEREPCELEDTVGVEQGGC